MAAVLLRHGLGWIVDLVDLRGLVPGARESRRELRHSGPEHLRLAFEELGPTFIKLGQVLSTRPDLVPPEYESALAVLQDAAQAVPTVDIVSAVEAAFGHAIGQTFRVFAAVPIAAASIGQVHAATLLDGTEVVVKVRRPGVGERVTADLELLDRFANMAARRSSIARRYDPVGLAKEFGTTLRAELDYPREGHNADLVAASFVDEEQVHIPRVFWEFTRDEVITEERIRGIKVDDLRSLDAAGLDRARIARTLADAYLSMVFAHRFFHADPHPGNVFVEMDGRVAFVDFGMVGSVTAHTGHGLGTILLALVATDPTKMADGLLRLGIASADVDRTTLERDLAQFLEQHAHLPLEQLHLGPLIAELMSVVRAHRLRLPSDLALLLKTVMMCEGVAAQLDPTFEL
ncbi:MAG TPA: AarF/UbiB family protein, partial [Gemmatimonadaceae bacterium]|nr:AarF/UbiB family protein [Gemmatimonadaceae bacterium]